MAILPAGLAHSHMGNQAASLRIQQLYGTPVLLSGMASLVLKKSEIKMLQQHYKLFLERIQKLYRSSPEPFVYFLAGSLPLTALLHLRQLTLLGMIARLGSSNILFRHGLNICSSSNNKHSNSWFMKLKHICSQYGLPTPYQLLLDPPSQSSFKTTIKGKVIDFWEKQLRGEASKLSSIKYFRVDFTPCQSHILFGQLLAIIHTK